MVDCQVFLQIAYFSGDNDITVGYAKYICVYTFLMVPISVPYQHKKVQSFIRHFRTEFLQSTAF